MGNQIVATSHQRFGERLTETKCFESRPLTRIKWSYGPRIERAREFFGELRNFADLMPGIEGIRKEAGGIMRWMVRAEVPVIGAVHATFTVEKTEDSPERLEWSPPPPK